MPHEPGINEPSRLPFYVLILLLLIIGVALSVIRNQDYGVPWTPSESRQVWDIEARIEFTAVGGPVKAVSYTHLTLPTTPYV